MAGCRQKVEDHLAGAKPESSSRGRVIGDRGQPEGIARPRKPRLKASQAGAGGRANKAHLEESYPSCRKFLPLLRRQLLKARIGIPSHSTSRRDNRVKIPSSTSDATWSLEFQPGVRDDPVVAPAWYGIGSLLPIGRISWWSPFGEHVKS